MKSTKTILSALNLLGFDTNKPFLDCLDDLVQEHIKLMSEIEIDNIEYIKRTYQKTKNGLYCKLQ